MTYLLAGLWRFPVERLIHASAAMLLGRATPVSPFLAHLNDVHPRVPTLERGSAAAGMLGHDAVVKARGCGLESQ